jgi:hypothetical protein
MVEKNRSLFSITRVLCLGISAVVIGLVACGCSEPSHRVEAQAARSFAPANLFLPANPQMG